MENKESFNILEMSKQYGFSVAELQIVLGIGPIPKIKFKSAKEAKQAYYAQGTHPLYAEEIYAWLKLSEREVRAAKTREEAVNAYSNAPSHSKAQSLAIKKIIRFTKTRVEAFFNLTFRETGEQYPLVRLYHKLYEKEVSDANDIKALEKICKECFDIERSKFRYMAIRKIAILSGWQPA